MARLSIASFIGPICVFESEGSIVAVRRMDVPDGDGTPVLREARDQLEAYFRDELRTFDLPLAPAGSGFQQRVYREMQAIEHGRTRTYGEIAEAVGCSAQAVGQACGSNPIPIIIPCHRVLAANGLGGFSGWGGVETKAALLRHERAYSLLL